MEYEINDDRVDSAHRSILQLLESFAALPEESDRETVGNLLMRISDHVDTHFAEEELIFQNELGMPADYVAFHKAEHQKLRDRVLSIVEKERQNRNNDFLDQVASLQADMERHITEVDSRMVPYSRQ
jgi:hemerythrin-like metal-binding protein